MGARVALCITLAGAAGCDAGAEQREPARPGAELTVEASEAPAPANRPDVELHPRAMPEGPSRVVGSDLAPQAIEDHLRTAPATRYRPAGRGEIVFALTLDAPVDALWIPATDDDPHGWSHEVAAWRVARCIGLDQVPPAAVRSVRPEVLRERLDPAFGDLWDELQERIRWDADGTAPGAAVMLVRDARPSGLSRGRRLERWSRHLEQGVPPDRDRRRVHADLADLFLFDYLVGYPSRFEDGLVALRGLERLVLRDHRGAFAVREHPELREQMLNVEKLTPPWAEGLPACDGRMLSAVLRDERGEHLLTPAQMVALRDRRRTLLSHAAALVDAHGRDQVVVLP